MLILLLVSKYILLSVLIIILFGYSGLLVLVPLEFDLFSIDWVRLKSELVF